MHASHHRTAKARGFTLTELLVVIAIIVLLLGMLLVAIGKVQSKSRRTQTEALIQQFANACSAFQSENGRYPGVISEVLLAANPLITSTENALLDLMGGYRVLGPNDPRTVGNPIFDEYTAFQTAAQQTNSLVGPLNWAVPGTPGWDLVIDTRKIGEGPVINRKPHAPYFTPGPSDLAKAKYEPSTNNANAATTLLPDLIDSWGQPILYLRQLRDRGPLVADAANIPAPQFLRGAIDPYLQATAFGESGNSQMTASILNTAPTPAERTQLLWKILEHPSIADQARGAFCLISAGADGIFFSATDGPGSSADPIDNTGNITFNTVITTPKVIDEFDDVRVFGGG